MRAQRAAAPRVSGNASHFTREYKRFFGAPPMHDVERLREAAREGFVASEWEEQ